jgi:predicted esterase
MKYIFMVLSLLLSVSIFAATPTRQLPAYKIDPRGITTSGVSAGAYMAVQLDVAYSKTFSGAGTVAGGIYWCAQGSSQKATRACMKNPSEIDPKTYVEHAIELAQKKLIDPLENLRTHRLFMFASPKDPVVNPQESEKLNTFYANWVAPTQITWEKTVATSHGFPTLNSGGPCGVAGLPWILKCNYDTAGEILKALYGPLEARGKFDPSHLVKFTQSEFGNESIGLYREGWLYVPATCNKGETCKLHVALHGCQMNPTFVKDKFVTLAGYNEWAESNRIIVLYPQVLENRPANPYACWDWYGYTGDNYAEQSGPQMIAIKRMVDRLQGQRFRLRR